MRQTCAQAEQVLAEARAWLGTPYRHQASLKGIGSDCLGLVRGVWRSIHGEEPARVPAYTGAWAETGGTEDLRLAADRFLLPVAGRDRKPGHVLLFRLKPNVPAKHLGILSGTERFIHAYDGSAVVESALSDFWERRIAGVYAFPAKPKSTDIR